MLEYCRALFSRLVPETDNWHIEAHQFRIEARVGEHGKPTPEGMHRDGVDYVLNLAVVKSNRWEVDLAANAEAVGLLMAHCRGAAARSPPAWPGAWRPPGWAWPRSACRRRAACARRP